MTQQPILYCLCGAVAIDENAVGQNGSMTHQSCGKTRCAPCMWKHLRECEPALYLSLRTRLQLGQINERFEIRAQQYKAAARAEGGR